MYNGTKDCHFNINAFEIEKNKGITFPKKTTINIDNDKKLFLSIKSVYQNDIFQK